MKRFCLSALGLVLALALLAAPLNPTVTLAATEPPPPEDNIDPNLSAAFQARVADTGQKVLAFLANDIRIVKVEYSEDGSLALMWLGMFDPNTGEQIEGEPGLAIGQQIKTDVGADAWTVSLQADSDWQTDLDKVPDELLPSDVRQLYAQSGEKAGNEVQTTFSGYKLPWAAGVSGLLSQSISHDSTSCTSGLCHYAFDFARIGGVRDWPILASRGGTVYMWKTNIATRDPGACPGDGSTGNYIVLEDKSTNPTTYQLYLHMAANSVPSSLLKVGAVVQQGDSRHG